MKVSQLISKLSKLNPDAEVILASDAEGNSHNELSMVYGGKNLKFARILEKYNDGMEIEREIDFFEDKYDYEDFDKDAYTKLKPCVILYPR